MINKIYQTEIKYIENFCEKETFENHIRFKDNNIKDMYSHNFTYIKHDISDEEILKIISSEIDYRKETNKGFLRVVTSAKLSTELLSRFLIKPEVERYDYFGVETEVYHNLNEKENTKILLADTPKVSDDGRAVDIIANYKHMTLEFAIRRIDRKFEIYSNNSKALNLYVCYDDIEPVGNCELMINDDIAKIEDFDIIEMHQRKGFGTHVIKNLLKICYDQNVKQAYLVTDHNDTAKEMYLKNGLKVVGQRSEMMFILK